MKTILLAGSMLLLASWATADSIPQCPDASLSYYDTSLPNGCQFGGVGEGENFWSNFSSPMTSDPGLIQVAPECLYGGFGQSSQVPACGFDVSGGTVDNMPSLDFQVVLAKGVGTVGAYSLNLCGGPTGSTAEGYTDFNGQVITQSVTSPPGKCDASVPAWFGIDFTDSVQSWAKIDSGSGTVSYFVGVGPEPGTMTLLLLGGGFTLFACRRRKLNPHA